MSFRTMIACTFVLSAFSLDANGGERRGQERGRGFGEGGHGRENREVKQGETLVCAQQLGITMPVRGSGTQLTSDQRTQLQACIQNQRAANRQAEKAQEQADLAACAQQLGITVPAAGTAPSWTQDQRRALRQCLSKDRRTEHQTFEQAVQACLTANGVTPGQPQQLDQATRQKVEICVALAANQGATSSGTVTSSATATDTNVGISSSTSTSTDPGTLTETSTSTSTSVTTISP